MQRLGRAVGIEVGIFREGFIAMVRSVHIDAGVEAYAQGCTRLGFSLQVRTCLDEGGARGWELLHCSHG